jgi:hypothetical protein
MPGTDVQNSDALLFSRLQLWAKETGKRRGHQQIRPEFYLFCDSCCAISYTSLSLGISIYKKGAKWTQENMYTEGFQTKLPG